MLPTALTQCHNIILYSESNRKTLLTGLENENATDFFPILDAVDWTPEAVQSFKDSVLNTPQIYFCSGDEAEVGSLRLW